MADDLFINGFPFDVKIVKLVKKLLKIVQNQNHTINGINRNKSEYFSRTGQRSFCLSFFYPAFDYMRAKINL